MQPLCPGQCCCGGGKQQLWLHGALSVPQPRQRLLTAAARGHGSGLLQRARYSGLKVTTESGLNKAAAALRAGPRHSAAPSVSCRPAGRVRLAGEALGGEPLPPGAALQRIGTSSRNKTDVTKASSKHRQTPLGHCRERCTWKNKVML